MLSPEQGLKEHLNGWLLAGSSRAHTRRRGGCGALLCAICYLLSKNRSLRDNSITLTLRPSLRRLGVGVEEGGGWAALGLRRDPRRPRLGLLS